MNYSPLNADVDRRFRAPSRAGTVDNPRAMGEAGGPASGTWTRIELRFADGGHIAAARFLCFGCPSAIAAADWLCERVENATPEQAEALRGLDIADALGLVGDKLGVALVAEDALKAALADTLGMASRGKFHGDQADR